MLCLGFLQMTGNLKNSNKQTNVNKFKKKLIPNSLIAENGKNALKFVALLHIFDAMQVSFEGI